MATAIRLALTNWRTSGAGLLVIIIQVLNALIADPTFAPYADKLSLAVAVLALFVARDAKVSDQKAGLRPETGAGK